LVAKSTNEEIGQWDRLADSEKQHADGEQQ
jgi:hypothetical protein